MTGNEKLEETVKCVIYLANAMVVLHCKGIVHRDIKPSNIFFYNNKYGFGDLGLVDYTEEDDIIHIKELVSAKATIVPEMK